VHVASVAHKVQTKAEPAESDAPAAKAGDPVTTKQNPAAVAAENKEIVARRRLSFHVSRLMTELRSAIASGNATEARQKLDALERLASPDSLTLLRARAYWALTQGHLNKAMQRYRSILQRVPDDRDAMLNLTVTEWQVGQKSDALARIENLAKRFPDDPTVQRYLRVMEGR